MSDKFCFYHGTHYENLPLILKDGYIKSGSKVPNTAIKSYKRYEYISCSMLFDECTCYNRPYFPCGIIINKNILNDHTVVFNSFWRGDRPCLTESESNEYLNNLNKNKHLSYSIYLYPSDTAAKRNKKIKLIKEYIKNHKRDCFSSHEFIFSFNINLSKYADSIFTPKYSQQLQYVNNIYTVSEKEIEKEIKKLIKNSDIKLVKYDNLSCGDIFNKLSLSYFELKILDDPYTLL
jgi:hypothetical protein